MEHVRWGIIGCGNVTEAKSGPAFRLARNSSLVHVMRRQGDLAKDYALRHGVPRYSDDAAELIGDPEVDAVYIATPPGSHREYALACARAGKICYVEKPMARTFGECREMLTAFDQAKVPLFVAYYRRALPRFLKLREIVDSGVLGAIRTVHAMQEQKPDPDDGDSERRAWRLRPEISGGGRFLDLASHTLDVLDFLFGPIDRVSGLAKNLGRLYGAEDYVAGTFRFASGAEGSGRWCFCADENRELVEVVGERGLLRFSIFGNEDLELRLGSGTQFFGAANPSPIQLPLIQTIVDELTGNGRCPSTGESAARTSRIMDLFLEEFRRENKDNPESAFI